jgi:hypothetical protein
MFTAAAIVLVAASAGAERQPQAPAERRLAFEAATVKLAATDAVRNQVVPTSPNRLYIPSMTLTWLIYAAYGDGGFNTSPYRTVRPAIETAGCESTGPPCSRSQRCSRCRRRGRC